MPLIDRCRELAFRLMRQRGVGGYCCVVASILLTAFALRLLGLEKGLWLDEYAVQWALSRTGLVRALLYIRAINLLPLYYLLLKLWSGLGAGEAFLRLPSVFLGLATVAVAMRWMRPISRLASALAGLCFAALPILLRYAQEIQCYGLLVLAATCAFFFASRLVAEPRARSGYLGLALSLTVAAGTHLVGVTLIAAVVAYVALAATDRTAIDLRRGAAAVGAPVAAFLFLLVFYSVGLDERTANWWMPPVSLALVRSTAAYMLGMAPTPWALQALQRVWPAGSAWLEYLVAVPLLIGVAAPLALGQWRRGFPLLAAALVYGLQVVAYSLVRTPIFWYRTLLPGLVPLLAFVVTQAATIRWRWARRVVAMGLAALSLLAAAGWVARDAGRPVEAWRDVAHLLASRWRTGGVVLFYPDYARGATRHYFPALPDAAVVAVPIGSSDARTAAEVVSAVGRMGTGPAPAAVFLVVRVDLSVQADRPTWREMLAQLHSSLDRPAAIEVLLITCSDGIIQPGLAATRYELLQDLQVVFGPPTLFQDQGSFAWLMFALPEGEER